MDRDPVTLTFTASELAVLNDALVQMPYGRVAALVASINAQLMPPPPPPVGQDRLNHEFASDLGHV